MRAESFATKFFAAVNPSLLMLPEPSKTRTKSTEEAHFGGVAIKFVVLETFARQVKA
jgi:hypothetical protein